MRSLLSLPLALVLAVVIHTDWHLARPHHMRLSLDWDFHWLLALPVFALAAGYVARRWPSRTWEASAVNLAATVFFAQVLEPLGEILYYRDTWRELVDPLRWTVFAQFAAAGLLAYICVMALLQRESPAEPAAARVRPEPATMAAD